MNHWMKDWLFSSFRQMNTLILFHIPGITLKYYKDKRMTFRVSGRHFLVQNTIHDIPHTIYNRNRIFIYNLLYHSIIQATDYKVIGGPSETRMRSAKQNQDFQRKSCISLKAIWHESHRIKKKDGK